MPMLMETFTALEDFLTAGTDNCDEPMLILTGALYPDAYGLLMIAYFGP